MFDFHVSRLAALGVSSLYISYFRACFGQLESHALGVNHSLTQSICGAMELFSLEFLTPGVRDQMCRFSIFPSCGSFPFSLSFRVPLVLTQQSSIDF